MDVTISVTTTLGVQWESASISQVRVPEYLALHDLLLCPVGRNCDDPDCKGRLKDTIINFGENLPDSGSPVGSSCV